MRVQVPDGDAHAELVHIMTWSLKYPWGRALASSKANRFGLQKFDRIVLGGDLLTDPVTWMPWSRRTIFFCFRPRAASSLSASSIMWPVPGLHNLGIRHFKMEYMMDCVLHCVDLGIAQRYSAYTFKVALRCNVFGILRPPGHNILEAGIMEIRQDLKEDYYPRMTTRTDRRGNQK